jgi:hypothetical protein
MSNAFDEFTKALAAGMSRRAALKRFALATGGVLFGLSAGRASAGSTVASRSRQLDCKRFCAWVYGEGTHAYNQCVKQAHHHEGLCYQYGPSSKECKHVDCPDKTFCVSNAFNFNGTTAAVGTHCVPALSKK